MTIPAARAGGKRSPLEFKCPRCGAGIGARCHNHKNRPCKPHRERKPKHVPNVQAAEVYEDSFRARDASRQAILLEWMKAVSVCGHYQGARYARWRLHDRSGAEPDRLVHVVMRPGVSGWRDREGRTIEDIDSGGERLGPPFAAYFTQRPGDTSPGGFGFRWERRFESIEVPEVLTAEELHAAAEKRRAKALERQAAEAAALAEWKARNETPSLFEAAGILEPKA